MKSKYFLLIPMILLFLIYLLMMFLEVQHRMLNIQSMFEFRLLPIVFWIAVIMLCIFSLRLDIGFFKIICILGVVFSISVISFNIVYFESSFETIESNDHQLILEVVEPPGRKVIVYRKVNNLYSEYVGEALIGTQYELSFEISGDTLIINKCTSVTCVVDEIELEAE